MTKIENRVTLIEKQLQFIEQIESESKDMQANLIASLLAQIVITIPREQLVSFFKSMLLQDSDILEFMIDFTKTKLLKQYREAIKTSKREIKIKRI
jgi:hypothetical protein